MNRVVFFLVFPFIYKFTDESIISIYNIAYFSMLVNRGKRKMYGVESICRMTDLFFDEGQTGGGGAPLSMPPLLERGGVTK